MSLMVGGPLDGRDLDTPSKVVSVPVQLWRGRGRVWTQSEYEREVRYEYPPAPEPCPTCGHCDDDYQEGVRIEPTDLVPFFAVGNYRASNGWRYEPPALLEETT